MKSFIVKENYIGSDLSVWYTDEQTQTQTFCYSSMKMKLMSIFRTLLKFVIKFARQMHGNKMGYKALSISILTLLNLLIFSQRDSLVSNVTVPVGLEFIFKSFIITSRSIY